VLADIFNWVGVSGSGESCCDSFLVVSTTSKIPKSLEGPDFVFSRSSFSSKRVELVGVRYFYQTNLKPNLKQSRLHLFPANVSPKF